MATPATKSQTPATEPTTALEQLRGDRAELTQRLAQISATRARLRAAGLAEAAVIEEIGTLGKSEIQAVTAWATAGGVGDPPAPDAGKRRTLATKLAGAQAAAAAATGSLADLDHQIRELTAQLADAERAIERAALDIAAREFSEIQEQHAATMAEGGKLAARMHGLCSYLSNNGRTLIDRGDQEGGRAYLARAEAMTAIKLPQGGVSQHEIFAAAETWARRIATLRRSSPRATAATS